MTRPATITEEQAISMVLRELMAPVGEQCPPHQFQSCWAQAPEGNEGVGDGTLPAMLCVRCGEVRALRIPEG